MELTRSTTSPALLHLAAQTAAARPGVRGALDRAARSITRNDHADGSRHPWTRMTPASLMQMRADLVDRYAASTVNGSLAAVRSVLRLAWMTGDIGRDHLERALAALPRARGNTRPARILTAADVARLFRAAADQRHPSTRARDAALLALGFGGGLRRRELCEARREDLERGETWELRVHGKGAKWRVVYLANGCAAALEAWLSVRGDDPGSLLYRVGKGGVVDPSSLSPAAINKRVVHLGALAGVRLSPHDMRRYYGTLLLAHGNDLAVASRCLGHSSPTTTMRYDTRGLDEQRMAAATVTVPYTGGIP